MSTGAPPLANSLVLPYVCTRSAGGNAQFHMSVGGILASAANSLLPMPSRRPLPAPLPAAAVAPSCL